MKKQKIRLHNFYGRELDSDETRVYSVDNVESAIGKFLKEQFNGACEVTSRGISNGFLVFRPRSGAKMLCSVFKTVALRAPLLVSFSKTDVSFSIDLSFSSAVPVDDEAIRRWTVFAEDAGFSIVTKKSNGNYHLTLGMTVSTFTPVLRARSLASDFYEALLDARDAEIGE